ncbi:SEC-C domain-containing protein [Streptomyces sp. NPDC001315]|uniref:SEC-C domain-containing protein n=1 Tax=Streptomyces sp. NPDC001315 TaxID=3364562 RepID=UPI00367B7168
MSSKHRTGAGNGKNRPSASLPTIDDATVARECESVAAECPEDREELLLEAADAWNEAGEHDRAITLYERLLDPGSGGLAEPDLVDAYRIDTLWDAGRDEEARAAAGAFRRRHPRHAGAWNFVAESFESRNETATAAEWFTAGVTHALGAGTPVTADTVERDPHHFDVEMLVIGRHRVRRLLGEPHDDWDQVADVLHERRAAPFLGHVRPLDEMHDPLLLKRTAEGAPELLEAEIAALTDGLTGGRRQTRGLRSTCVLYWPPEEFARLRGHWPKAAEAYGSEHGEHRRRVEDTLRELSGEGATHLAVGRASVRGLETYAAGDGGSPDVPATRSAYAAELARTGQVTDWPPLRNGPCWCGSARKYKKCCGNPALQ